MSHYSDDELTLYHYGEAPRGAHIEAHLQGCDACATTYRHLAGTLALIGDLEVPERDERYGLEVWQRIRHDLPPRDEPWWAAWRRSALVGAVAMLVVAAFVAGRLWPGVAASPHDDRQATSLSEVRGELRQMREMLMLSLMQQQSATERLRGVSASVQIDRPGTEIIQALLDALMHDSNANVRLACVDALRRFSEQDVVRRGAMQALRQSSYPLVQVALIDFMVETRDKTAIDALRLLSEDPTEDVAVRDRAAWAVAQLRL